CRADSARPNRRLASLPNRVPMAAPIGKHTNSRSKNSDGMMKKLISRNSARQYSTVLIDSRNRAAESRSWGRLLDSTSRSLRLVGLEWLLVCDHARSLDDPKILVGLEVGERLFASGRPANGQSLHATLGSQADEQAAIARRQVAAAASDLAHQASSAQF